MDARVAETAGRLAVAVGRIDRRIRPKTPGLSHGMLSLLSTVVRLGPIRPSDLARIEVIAAPSATRALAELESQAFITRTPDPDDGRSWFIASTEAGAAAVLHARGERAELVAELMTGLSADQVEAIAAALDALEATATAPSR